MLLSANVRLYLIVAAICLGTRVQVTAEAALNTMQFVLENWIRVCYPGITEAVLTILQSSTRFVFIQTTSSDLLCFYGVGCFRALFYAGCASGSILTTLLCDRIGRQKCLLLAMTIGIISSATNVLSIYIDSFPLYLIARYNKSYILIIG